MKFYPVTPTNPVILTNKSISLSTNTVTGTLAQFNTACTDANFARTDAANTFVGIQTLSGTGRLLDIGDDSFISDVNVANTARLSGASDATTATLQLGSGGGQIKGNSDGTTEVPSLNIGNADTTITRVSGGVIAVEGVTLPTISSTSTITNKRQQPRIVSAASYTTDTGTSLDFSTCDVFIVTAQAGALKFNNPSGTPVHGEKIIIRVKDNGTARALTYDTQYRAVGITLPTTTVISKTLYLGGIWNTTDTKLDIIAYSIEA